MKKAAIPQEFKKSFIACTKINLIICISILLGMYPTNMTSFDAALTILCTVFLVFLFPKMRKGKIKAYYTDYNGIFHLVFLIMLLVPNAIIRYIVYLVRNLWGTESSVGGYLKLLGIVIISSLNNPIIDIIAIIIFGLAIYILFYADKKTLMINYNFSMKLTPKETEGVFVVPNQNKPMPVNKTSQRPKEYSSKQPIANTSRIDLAEKRSSSNDL